MKKDIFCLLAFLVLIIILFFDPLITGKVYFLDDIEEMTIPMRRFQYDSYQAGKVNMWNPYQFAGNCFLADPATGLFFPLNWLFFFIPPERGVVYFIIICHFLGGVFTFLMLRDIKISRLGAFAGAVFFAFSGQLLVKSVHMVLVSSVILLPLIFFLTNRFLKEKNLIWALFLGLSMGSHMLIGHYICSQLMFIIIFLYFFSQLQLKKSSIKVISLFLLAVVFALCVQAVQFFPSYEFVKQCPRIGGFSSYKVSSYVSMNPGNILTFFVPDIYGNPLRKSGFTGKFAFWDNCCYIGVFPIILALLLPFLLPRSERKRAVGFFLTMLFILLYSLGKNTPLYRFMYDYFPFFNTHHIPIRYIPLMLPGMAYFIGLSVDLLSEFYEKNNIIRNKRMKFILLVFGILFIVLFFLIINKMKVNPGSIASIFHKNRMSNYQAGNKTKLIYTGLLFFILTGFIGLVVIFLSVSGIIKKNHFKIGAIIIIVISAFSFGYTWNPAVDISYFKHREELFAPFRNKIPPFRIVYHPGVVGGVLSKTLNTPASQKVSNLQGYNPMVLKNFIKYMTFAEKGQLPDKKTFELMSLWGNRLPIATRVLNTNMIRMLNPQFSHLTTSNWNPESPTWFEIEDPYPRAFIVHNHVVLRSEKGILDYLFSPIFNPRNVIILSEEPVDFKITCPVGNEKRESKVEFIEFEPDYIKLKVDVARSGWLFLSEIYYLGWKCKVDGKERKVYRGNYLFRAIPLMPGDKIVEVYFTSDSLKKGGIISLCSLVFFFIVAIFHYKGKNRSTEMTGKIHQKNGEDEE